MARRPNANPAEIERQLGTPPGDLGFKATTENRTLLKSWLRAKGLASAVVDRMKLDTLGKCYRSPAYLAAIVRNQGTASDDFAEPSQKPGSWLPYALTDERGNPVGAFETERAAWDFARAIASRNDDPAVFTVRNASTGAEYSQTLAPNPYPVNQTSKEPETMPDNVTPAALAGNDPAAAITSAIMGAVQSALANTPKSIDEAQIVALIEKHARPVYRVVIEEPGKEPRPLPDDEPRHEIFPEVLTCVSAGVNVLLVGPAGSGKTTIAEQVAQALGLPFEFTGALDSPYKLSGFIDAQGRVVSTAFRRAYENGGVFLFDEIDGSLPGALLAFNAALANGHADFPDGTVQRHPDFRVIAAANTYGHGADRQYVGRNQLDAASLDRFAVIDMDYDEELERALSGNVEWVRDVQKVRRAIRELKIRHVVSPRASIMGAKLLSAGMPRSRVLHLTVWRGLDAATREKIINAL